MTVFVQSLVNRQPTWSLVTAGTVVATTAMREAPPTCGYCSRSHWPAAVGALKRAGPS